LGLCISITGQANLPDDDHGDEEAKLFQETKRTDKSQKIQKFQWFISLLFTITISHTISLLSKDSELDRMSAKQLRCWLKDQGVRTSGYEVAVDTKLFIF
jgi:hypothetical protein